MPDPTTPYAGLTQPTVGADNNAWGALLNANFGLIDTFLRNIVPAGSIFPFAGSVGGGAPSGFLFCDGSAVSRATFVSLYAALGTFWGAGDGSTTFNLPDMRDRFPVGAGSTYALAASGGATSFTPTLSVAVAGHTLTALEMPGHSHTVTDSGHVHADAGHSHGVGDPGHNHIVVDAGHSHGYTALQAPFNGTNADVGSGGSPIGSQYNPQTSLQGTGVSLNAAFTGIAVASGNASIQTGYANLSSSSTGGNGAHSHTATATSNAVLTLPPYRAVNFIIKT